MAEKMRYISHFLSITKKRKASLMHSYIKDVPYHLPTDSIPVPFIIDARRHHIDALMHQCDVEFP